MGETTEMITQDTEIIFLSKQGNTTTMFHFIICVRGKFLVLWKVL